MKESEIYGATVSGLFSSATTYRIGVVHCGKVITSIDYSIEPHYSISINYDDGTSDEYHGVPFCLHGKRKVVEDDVVAGNPALL